MGEAERGEGGAGGAEGCRLRGGGEDREVRDPAGGYAEAEAQGRDEGGEEDDVRQGGDGCGQEGFHGGQGLCRQAAQGLDLSGEVRVGAPTVVLPRRRPSPHLVVSGAWRPLPVQKALGRQK